MTYTVDIKTLEINYFGVSHFCAEIQQALIKNLCQCALERTSLLVILFFRLS